MTVQKYQAHTMSSQESGEASIQYQTSQSGVSSHKIVNGKSTSETSGTLRAVTTSKDAGVMIGGISVAPGEAEEFLQEVNQESVELEKAEETEQQVTESFDNSTTLILDDLDKGDLANAVNLAVEGGLDDEGIANAVKSLGFEDQGSALEMGNNIINSLSARFQDIAEQEGFEMDTAWEALQQWNKAETGKAMHDWINGRGADDSRLRDAMREAWSNYGKADNSQLVEVLQADGYEVKRTQGGGIVVKGNDLGDWTTWNELRNSFKKL